MKYEEYNLGSILIYSSDLVEAFAKNSQNKVKKGNFLSNLNYMSGLKTLILNVYCSLLT